MKNREFIVANLEEAIGQLQRIVSELKDDPEYLESQFRIGLEHAYHHINCAWHIKSATEAELAECSEENFIKWSKFPIDEISEYE